MCIYNILYKMVESIPEFSYDFLITKGEHIANCLIKIWNTNLFTKEEVESLLEKTKTRLDKLYILDKQDLVYYLPKNLRECLSTVSPTWKNLIDTMNKYITRSEMPSENDKIHMCYEAFNLEFDMKLNEEETNRRINSLFNVYKDNRKYKECVDLYNKHGRDSFLKLQTPDIKECYENMISENLWSDNENILLQNLQKYKPTERYKRNTMKVCRNFIQSFGPIKFKELATATETKEPKEPKSEINQRTFECYYELQKYNLFDPDLGVMNKNIRKFLLIHHPDKHGGSEEKGKLVSGINMCYQHAQKYLGDMTQLHKKNTNKK